MEDIDEKFEPSMTEDKVMHKQTKRGYDRIRVDEREESASSTRIDPVGVYNGQYQSAPLQLYDSEEDEEKGNGETNTKTKANRCFCLVM